MRRSSLDEEIIEYLKGRTQDGSGRELQLSRDHSRTSTDPPAAITLSNPLPRERA